MTVREFQHEVHVTPADIDALGHASNVQFVRWMQDAAVAHSAALGWAGERYLDAGIAWVVRTHAITYLKPALCGDALVVRTWVADMKKTTSLRRYLLVRKSDQEILARGATNWVLIDRNRNLPRRIPPEIRDTFEVMPEMDYTGLEPS